MKKILVLNGPNLNLLGTREPAVYGSTTLGDIENSMKQLAQQWECELRFAQSNAEHELLGHIQNAPAEGVQFIIINPAAFTHTSVALRDGLAAVNIPFIELHISNVHQREEFRQHSYFSDLALGVICGLGAYGYQLAFMAAINHLNSNNTD